MRTINFQLFYDGYYDAWCVLTDGEHTKEELEIFSQEMFLNYHNQEELKGSNN